jgi:hypothetical protein
MSEELIKELAEKLRLQIAWHVEADVYATEMTDAERCEVVEGMLPIFERRIAALIAAGDKLAGYAEHVLDCNDNYRPRKPCDCGYTEAWKAWTEARGDE